MEKQRRVAWTVGAFGYCRGLRTVSPGSQCCAGGTRGGRDPGHCVLPEAENFAAVGECAAAPELDLPTLIDRYWAAQEWGEAFELPIRDPAGCQPALRVLLGAQGANGADEVEGGSRVEGVRADLRQAATIWNGLRRIARLLSFVGLHCLVDLLFYGIEVEGGRVL